MDVTVIVEASTTHTGDTGEHPTIGALADAVAETHTVAGDVFTLKVNGEIATRDQAASDLAASDVLELIEIPGAPGNTSDPALASSATPPANVGDPVTAGVDAAPAA